MNRVVITGLGAVTAIGNTVPEYWKNLIAGKGGISPITRISTEEHDTKVAAQVPDSFEAEASRYWKKTPAKRHHPRHPYRTRQYRRSGCRQRHRLYCL